MSYDKSNHPFPRIQECSSLLVCQMLTFSVLQEGCLEGFRLEELSLSFLVAKGVILFRDALNGKG